MRLLYQARIMAKTSRAANTMATTAAIFSREMVPMRGGPIPGKGRKGPSTAPTAASATPTSTSALTHTSQKRL
jgi:hypothetical protein